MSYTRTALNHVDNGPVRAILDRLGLLDLARTAHQRAMRIAVGETVTVTLAGVSVDFAPPDSMLDNDRFHAPEEFDESSLIEDMISELEDDDVVLDVGAHIGYHTCFAAEATPDGHVIAVEAHPLNSYEVLKNSRLNRHDTQVHSFALSNETGTQELSISADEVGGSTHTLADHSTESITVSTHRADDVLVVTPSVVKIDVEGAEQLVLEGMESILSDDECRIVYCELHHPGGEIASIEDFGGSVSEVRTLLEEHGFEIRELDERTGTYRTSDIKAVKQ